MMTKIFLPLFFSFVVVQGFSQTYTEIIEKADSLYYNKQYKEALQLYEGAFKNTPDIRNGDYYNAACFAALDGQLDKSETYLKKSIEKGWLDIDHMQKDEDLQALRQRPQWTRMIESIEAQFKEVKTELAKIKDYKTYELVPFKKGKHWGYLFWDAKKIAVKPIFDTLTFFFRNQAQAVFNTNNNITIEADGTFKAYRGLLFFNDEKLHFTAPKSLEELADLKETEKWFKKRSDRLKRLEPIKDRILPYGSEVYFFFYEEKKGEKGLLKFSSSSDTVGTKYLLNQIDTVFSFHKEDSEDAEKTFYVYAAAKNGKWGIINSELNWEIQPKYDEIKRCKRICDGYCFGASLYYGFYFLVREGTKVYYINGRGEKYVSD